MISAFINFASKDRAFVDYLNETLKESGIQSWIYTQEQEPGKPLDKHLENAIDACDLFLAILTPNYVESEFCLMELAYAKQENKVILPIIASEEEFKLPLYLVRLIYVDLHEWEKNTPKHQEEVRSLIDSALNGVQSNPRTIVADDKTTHPDLVKYLGDKSLGRAWGAAISIAECPEIEQGWLMSEIELDITNTEFKVPPKYQIRFNEYLSKSADKLYPDNPKIMLLDLSFAGVLYDKPELHLKAGHAKYSQFKFYTEVIGRDPKEKEELLDKLFISGEIAFPQAFCMHAVIVTTDNKVLIVRRKKTLAFHPRLWQCSVTEQFDLSKDTKSEKSILIWGQRLLTEEINFRIDKPENFRILSVFLEVDLPNIAVCALIRVDISSEELDFRLENNPPRGAEFDGWEFVSFDGLYDEIFAPSKDYVPTAGYVMRIALAHLYGYEAEEKILTRIMENQNND